MINPLSLPALDLTLSKRKESPHPRGCTKECIPSAGVGADSDAKFMMCGLFKATLLMVSNADIRPFVSSKVLAVTPP
jgi:hypothetical protein